MPVVFDEVTATVGPDRRATQTEPQAPPRPRRSEDEELRRRLRLAQQRQSRLKAD